MGSMYTQDAYLMPPQADFVRGRDDIQKFWKAAGEQVGDLKLATLDVKPLGSDAAREIGTFTLKTKGQQQQEVVGKYVVVWQKDEGDWKLAADIWNTNKYASGRGTWLLPNPVSIRSHWNRGRPVFLTCMSLPSTALSCCCGQDEQLGLSCASLDVN